MMRRFRRPVPPTPCRERPMLNFFSHRPSRMCDGVSRRAFLTAGGLCVGGLTLADLLRLRADAPDARQGRHHGLPQRRAVATSTCTTSSPTPRSSTAASSSRSRPTSPAWTSANSCRCRRRSPTSSPIIRNMKFQQEGHTAPELYTGFLHGRPPVDRLGRQQAPRRRRRPRPAAALRLPRRRQPRRPSGLPRQEPRGVHPRREGGEPRAVDGGHASTSSATAARLLTTFDAGPPRPRRPAAAAGPAWTPSPPRRWR